MNLIPGPQDKVPRYAGLLHRLEPAGVGAEQRGGADDEAQCARAQRDPGDQRVVARPQLHRNALGSGDYLRARRLQAECVVTLHAQRRQVRAAVDAGAAAARPRA